MNFSISQHDALVAMQRVIGATEKRDYMQILSYVKIDVSSEGTAKFTATNLDMQTSDIAKVASNKTFSFTAPIYTLLEIVKKMPENSNIDFTISGQDSQKIKVSGANCKFELSSMPVSEFPVMSDISFDTKFEVPASDILAALKNVQFAMSNDEVRLNLNGIMFHSNENDAINFVATDGHRLAFHKLHTKHETPIKNTIIPRRAVSEIVKILSGSSENVMLSISEKKLMVTLNNIMFITKLIDASFPDYARVIPESNDKIVKIVIQDLKSAIERVSIVNMRSDNKGMMFKIAASELLLSSTIDSDTSSEQVAIEFDSSDIIEMKYNYRYILDAVSHLASQKCLIKISSPDKPILVQPLDKEDKHVENQKFVVMPMRA